MGLMAGLERTAVFTPSVGRTIERVAIAALAALAARGEGESLALAVVSIFCIIAVGEELGRGVLWRGHRVSVWTLVAEFCLRRTLWDGDSARRDRGRRKRPGAYRRKNKKAAYTSDRARR